MSLLATIAAASAHQEETQCEEKPERHLNPENMESGAKQNRDRIHHCT